MPNLLPRPKLPASSAPGVLCKEIEKERSWEIKPSYRKGNQRPEEGRESPEVTQSCPTGASRASSQRVQVPPPACAHTKLKTRFACQYPVRIAHGGLRGPPFKKPGYAWAGRCPPVVTGSDAATLWAQPPCSPGQQCPCTGFGVVLLQEGGDMAEGAEALPSNRPEPKSSLLHISTHGIISGLSLCFSEPQFPP